MRLTIQKREELHRKIMISRFSEIIVKIVEDQEYFTKKVFSDVFSIKEHNLINSIPNGWLPTREWVDVKFQDKYTRMNLNGVWGFSGDTLIPLELQNRNISKPVPYEKIHGCLKVYEADHELTKEFTDLQNRQIDLKQGVSEASKILFATLNSFTTLAALLKGWPEVKKFIPEDWIKQKTLLPTIQLEKLNATFNLK